MPDDFDREKLPKTQSTGLNYPGTNNPQGGLVLSPEIPEKGKPEPTQRAIRDAGMAKDVVNTVVQANTTRNIIYNRITAKMNAERPFDNAKLVHEGLGWKNNFTTKPMSSMANKVYPKLTEAVQGMKYLTNASLADKWIQASEKTEFFRSEFTKLVRTRKGWRTFLDNLALTDVMFGSVVIATLDPYSWFPTCYKQDESFLTDGTKQLADAAQVVVLKETFLPHELFERIKDREAAEAAGWDIENTIKAINKASPNQLKDTLGSATTQNWYQRAVRELTVGSSYMAGASVISCYSLLVREVTGKVSHYRLGGVPELDLLYGVDDAFKSMSDVVAFFSFEKGNDTMHGSKGIGRDVYELAGMVDRTRNEAVDRMVISGKQLFQGDPKQIHKFRMSVVGAACIVPAGWTLLDQKIDGNVEPFLKMDAYFTMLVDQLVGAVSPTVPPSLQGEAGRSPQAWNIVAGREEENRDARISRFLEQFVTLVSQMQKRACDPDTTEEDAKEFQKRMLSKLTREELNELAEQPVAETIRDLTPIQRQMVVMLAQEKKGNPLYNQKQLEIEDLTARVSAEFAKKVLIPDQDPTMKAEQTRLQQMELALLATGQPVPVSPRDDHVIHLQMLMPTIEQIAGALMQGQTSTESFKAVLSHLNEHYQYAKGFGAPKEILSQVEALLKGAQKAIAELEAMDQQAAQLQSASENLGTEAELGQAPPEGAPPVGPM